MTTLKQSMPSQAMGHIQDTPATREIEERLGYQFIGCDACWTVVRGRNKTVYRVYARSVHGWHGVYNLTADDLEIYD